MQGKRYLLVAGISFVAAGAVGIGCLGFGDLEGGSCSVDCTDGAADAGNAADASGDAPYYPPPDAGFYVVVTPAHLTGDPGDMYPVQITVVRADNFDDPIAFQTTPANPAQITAQTPANSGNGGTSSMFTVSFASNAASGDTSLTLSSSNPGGTFVQNTTIGIRVGSEIDISDGGFLIPSYAIGLTVKAWGAGGGGGATESTFAGGAGGGGGFAANTMIPVSPGEMLLADIGTGGGAGTTQLFGGGGGGFSDLRTASGTVLLLAGGGGGGGAGSSGDGTTGVAGGAGGGATGQSFVSSDSACGSGGTQTAGGAGGGVAILGVQGSSMHGGAGGGSVGATDGGAPGGGSGGEGPPAKSSGGGGGGGGGWFGGGGGGGATLVAGTHGGGGGGGSSDQAVATTTTAGSGTTPANNTDPDYRNGVGVGGATGVSGGPGLVIVRLLKP